MKMIGEKGNLSELSSIHYRLNCSESLSPSAMNSRIGTDLADRNTPEEAFRLKMHAVLEP